MPTLGPVSYTHLDVYKRQPYAGEGNTVQFKNTEKFKNSTILLKILSTFQFY